MKHDMLVVAGAALALASCGQQQNSEQQANAPVAEAGRSYSGTGKVTAISGDEVTISHGPIEGIGWPAMTMAFKAPPGMAEGVGVGSEVSFAFRQDGGTYMLTRLDKR